MTLSRWLLALLFMTLTACQAYRAKPEGMVLYTHEELTKKGFVLAPMFDAQEPLDLGGATLPEYDLTLTSTLKKRWPSTVVLASDAIGAILGRDEIEAWRSRLKNEDVALASPSSLNILKKLTEFGQTYPKQVLLPSLLTNAVSCGQKEVLVNSKHRTRSGSRAYCQRTVKMRFRIMALDGSELLWNGLIYATQEKQSEPIRDEAEDPEQNAIDPPPTQALIEECFSNFAKQFGDGPAQ
jgi:hypothetical protein